MNNTHACADYFRQQKEWNRCFQKMRQKWESLGKTGGRIRLEHCTAEERGAIERFLGKKLWEDTVELSLQEFEQALQSTRFAGISLKELLEAFFNCELMSKQDKRAEKERRRERFYEKLHTQFQENGESYRVAVEWLEDAYDTKGYGYAILIRELEREPEAVENLVGNVGKALASVAEGNREIPLAVLAAEVSGNPHYLDRGTVAGTLLLHGLCSMLKCRWPESAYEWKLMLLEAHIVVDAVSSQVTTYGIHLERKDGIHAGMEAFCQMREPVVMTGFHMHDVIRAYAEHPNVFVVENEMVFGYLVEHIRKKDTALLCTSGQLRTTAVELIQLLLQEGTDIYYSGDLDPEGMGIADRLWQRQPEQIHLWRMSPSDYECSVSQELLEARSLAMLDHLMHPELQQTAQLVRQRKRAGYQENLLENLLADLNNFTKYSHYFRE